MDFRLGLGCYKLWHMRKLSLEGKVTIVNSLAISKVLQKDGALKIVDIEHKIASFKCSWVEQLYSVNFHKWKIIPRII